MNIKKICFIGKRNSYEKVFYESIKDPNLDVLVLDDELIAKQYTYYDKLPSFIQKYLQFNYLKNYFQKNQDTHFIFHEREKILQRVLKYLNKYDSRSFKGYLLIRNPLQGASSEILHLIDLLKDKNLYIGTFDTKDAKSFDIEFYNQYASKVDSVNTQNCNFDFSFVGKNKDRKSLIESIEANLSKENFKTKFKIIESDAQRIPYTEYLDFILDSRCLIDIVQKNQSGLTLRPLEALFYSRKLLTNNPMIIKEDFYHPNNIMIFNENEIDIDELKEFMKKPLINLPQSIVDQYMVENVINKIIESHYLN